MFDKQVFIFPKEKLYVSWKYLLDNQINPDDLLEYFVICKNRDCLELKPNGCETMVTNENKDEYVKLCIQFTTHEFVKDSM